MRWMSGMVLLSVLAGALSAAQQRVVSEATTEERVAGLLDLPGVLGDIQCQQFQPKSINYYSRPSKDGSPSGTIEAQASKLPDQPQCYQPTAAVRLAGRKSQTEDLPTEESGYEVQAAVVFERRGNWFRIALQRGFAWIERENLEGFLPYPAGLVSESHLTYLRQEWDGKLWSVPGSEVTVTPPRDWLALRDKQLPVRVLSTRAIGRDVWIQIKFETQEVCGQTLDKVTPLEGWIPAYRPDGATSVWFYSRGC